MTKFFEKKQTALIQAYKDVFETPQGEKVLFDLMDRYSMLMPTYSSKDSTEDMVFREGQRSVTLRILTMIETDMKRLHQIIKERQKQLKEEEENSYA